MIVSYLVLSMILAALLVWLSFRTGMWNKTDQELWSRYGRGSRKISVDNVDIRFKDEGSGPAVLLAHGAYGNLNLWDSWAEILVQHGYRVIRFDGPPEGLSSFDEKGHSHKRLAEIMRLLLDELSIEQCAVGGTSRGGAAALAFAGQHPERVSHLILTMVPVFDYEMPTFPLNVRISQWITDKLLSGYRPRFYWQFYLENLFVNRDMLTADLVSEYTDFSNRAGHRSRQEAIAAPGRSRNSDENKRFANSFRKPALILATGRDNALSLEHQEVLASWFPQESSKLVVIEDGGHFPSLEIPGQSSELVRKFLDDNK